MKNYITFIFTILLTTPALGADFYCERADSEVTFQGSDRYLTPQNFYVKEGDKVCIKFTTADNAKTLRIEGLPISLKAYPGQKANEQGFAARKRGEYKVVCVGCDESAKLIVQSPEEFSKKEQEINQLESYFNRRSRTLPSVQPTK